MNARERLASGLNVALSQVYLTRYKSSNRRHQLWIADVDPLSISAGRTPLLDCRPRDIWRPAPLGLDERGRRVNLPLMWTSVLVGAQPRKGRTFTARELALFAAQDPYCRLSVFDGKGSPDWRKFALVAYTYGFGLLRDNIQGDPVENLRATLRQAKTEVQEHNVRLSEMPTSVCPEGKLTREIAVTSGPERRYRYRRSVALARPSDLGRSGAGDPGVVPDPMRSLALEEVPHVQGNRPVQLAVRPELARLPALHGRRATRPPRSTLLQLA